MSWSKAVRFDGLRATAFSFRRPSQPLAISTLGHAPAPRFELFGNPEPYTVKANRSTKRLDSSSSYQAGAGAKTDRN